MGLPPRPQLGRRREQGLERGDAGGCDDDDRNRDRTDENSNKVTALHGTLSPFCRSVARQMARFPAPPQLISP